MDKDEEFIVMPTNDPIIDRSDCMNRLAHQIDRTRDPVARAMLVSMMDKVLHSISLPKQQGELVLLAGGRND